MSIVGRNCSKCNRMCIATTHTFFISKKKQSRCNSHSVRLCIATYQSQHCICCCCCSCCSLMFFLFLLLTPQLNAKLGLHYSKCNPPFRPLERASLSQRKVGNILQHFIVFDFSIFTSLFFVIFNSCLFKFTKIQVLNILV